MTPGLPKLNFTPQPPKAQASKGMSGQTRATGSATRGAVGQNVGKLDQRGTMSLFGIGAQRSNRVIGNMKAGYSAGISNLRHSLNDYRSRIDRFWVNQSLLAAKNSQIQNSGMSDLQKLMEMQVLLGGITQMGKGVTDVAGAIKDAKGTSAPKNKEGNNASNSSKEKNAGNGGEGGEEVKLSNVVSSSLKGMKSAKDGNTLQIYIDAAKTNKESVESDLKRVDAELKSLQGKTQGLKEASENAAKALETHTKETIPNQENTVKALQTDCDSKEMAYTNAENAYNKEPDNSPNKASLRTKMEQAKTAWEEAKNELKLAKDKLKDLKDKTNDLEKAATETKNALDTNEQEIKDKTRELKRLTKEKEKLSEEIPKQEQRLAKLNKQSQTEGKGTDKN